MINYLQNKSLKSLLVALFMIASGMASLPAQTIFQGVVASAHVFTVNSNGDRVLFSKGNLQYRASTKTWRFAENQWDCIGDANSNISSSYSGYIDLFGWGTSGYDHGANSYQPWSTIQNNSYYYAYGAYPYNLYDKTGKADWGYNAISNGGNTENNGWRTLTRGDWYYLFNSRNTSSGIRYAKATVNNVKGVILLPDDWSTNYYTLNSTNTSNASFSSNTFTASQWSTLEQHGVVFLPVAGRRNGSLVYDVGYDGYYWSASCRNSDYAWYVGFKGDTLSTGYSSGREGGFSVRLVRSSQNYSFGINVSSSPVEGGTVSGGGTYQEGAGCTLTATPSVGYEFGCWTSEGSAVSADSNYTFVVLGDMDLVAHFVEEGNITFADANVKALCVANWDTNADGELSFAEAVKVISLGEVFKNNTSITSFNELQYFTSLSAITSEAFYGCTELARITIPENVNSVGSKAFWNCPALQTVYFNAINCISMQTTYNSNTYSVFSSDASGGAPALTRVVIGNQVTRIPDYAFKGSEDIYQRLVIPASVASIGNYAFYNCNSMVLMVIQGNGLQTIGEYAFYGCSALASVLNLPNSVTTIGQYAFYGCLVLPSVTIGTGMATIGGYAFWNCPAMTTVNFNATNCTQMYTSTVTSSYEYVSYSVFNSGTSNGGATPIVTLNIGSNVTRIPDYAFRNSTNLTSDIIIPNATSSIGTYAFHGVKSTTLTIGTAVTSIGGYAFWNCPNLATVYFNATNCTQMYTRTVTSSSNYLYYSVFNSGTSNGGATPIVTLNIGSNVTRIPDYAFQNSTNLTSDIIIPNVTSSIGTYAFYGAKSTTLTIGTAVTSIGGDAFWNCPNLAMVNFNATNCTSMVTDSQYSVFNSGTSYSNVTPIVTLNIGNNVKRIPDYAFRNSGNMANNLVIPNSVTYIGQYAFAGSSGQGRTLLLGNAVKTIGQYAFQGCSGFTGDLVIPNSVSTLGQYAFSDCSGFNGTLTLSSNTSLTAIEQYTFNGCSGLTGTLTIPGNVVTIAGSAFRGCSGFTGALSLHDDMTTIGDYAFYGCTNIATLTIGTSITSIGGYAFWNCPALTAVNFNATNCTSMVTNSQYSVFNCGTISSNATPIVTLNIGSNVTRIPNYAFRKSSRLTCDIIIPNAVTFIGTYSFAECSGHNVTIGNGVVEISNYAFYNSSAINGTLHFGNTVETIGQYAFKGCNGFTGDLVIPNSVATLEKSAFQGCTGFDGSLIIGSGVQAISQYTFADCSGFLGSLIVGRQVNSVGNYAFRNCSGFTVAISENPTPPTAVNNSFQSMNFSIPLYVPYAMMPAYQSAAGWSQFTNCVEQCVFDQLDNDQWSDETNWYAMQLPGPTDVVCVNSNCQMDVSANVLHLYVLNLNDVLTINNGKTLTATYGVGSLQPSQIVVNDGGQLVNTISNAYGTVKKQINGYGTGDDGWYTIAAPIYGGLPVGGLTTGTYDLYYYDEPTCYWINMKQENNEFAHLNPAQGYLYANQSPKTLNLAGQLNASNAKFEIPVSFTSNSLAGFNLVGNPYTNNINITDVKINGTAQTAFYRADGGSGLVAYVAEDNEPIKPGDGFFVKATEEGTLSFGGSPTRGGLLPENSYVRLVLRKDDQVADRAYLRMNEGTTLEKMSASNAHSQLYFKNGGERYAIADFEPVEDAMPLFLDRADGTYTIEATLLNAKCEYLHLIDNMTGTDINLLETPSYTFTSKTTDYPSRFRLAFSPISGDTGGDNAPFAFVSNGNIIINGVDDDATLQVIDMIGRVVVCRDALNAPLPTAGIPAGVYVLRLISGDSVKTQKVTID